MTTKQLQKDITTFIEKVLFLLTKDVDVNKFQQILQDNVNQKRESATSTVEFYDRLMLNMAYFVENQMAWETIVRDTYGKGQVPKMSFLEQELMAQQMRVRNNVAENMDAYTADFHKRYEELQVTDEDVIYDYAYASVGHGLRVDFITLVTKKNAGILTKGNIEETLKIVDGYIAYHCDQIVNKLTLS
ncbi:MAG: DNA helicase [Solibacillus sp.]